MFNLQEAKDVLGSEETSLAQLKKTLASIDNTALAFEYSLGISANVILNNLDTYFKKYGVMNDVDIKVELGNYDDLLGDVKRFRDCKLKNMLVFLHFDNLLPSFESQIPNLNDEIIEGKLDELRQRLLAAFSSATSFDKVLVASFHLSVPGDVSGALNSILDAYNSMLRECVQKFENVSLIDLSRIVSKIGHINSLDRRFYYMNKSPYKTAFLNEFANMYAMETRGFGTKFYKAVVLDCDNTLWGGVVGEDLLDGIALDPHDFPGNIFWKIQNDVLSLIQQDAIICLCSKNNPEDVMEVLEKHEHCLLSREHIVAKRINWASKVDNIQELAEELNIGLESIVFIDDSSFECSSVREQLPEVKTIQVPKNLSTYPDVFQDVKNLFRPSSNAEGQISKTQQYRLLELARDTKGNFQSHEEYLQSLKIGVFIGLDRLVTKDRISELSLKSNQFNLTTRRYTPANILELMEDPDSLVIDLSIRDKFGDCGLTGAVICKLRENLMEIEAFFMSCRVLGRKAEFAIWPMIFDRVQKLGAEEVLASYSPTAKNQQVSRFYDSLGFELEKEMIDGSRRYLLRIDDFEKTSIEWIIIDTHDD